MGKEDVFVLNAGLEQRTSKTGKQRFVAVVKSEPIYVNTDPKQLGGEIAVAIAKHLREQVKGISARASDATLRARKAAEKAFKAGEPWALKRYGGGKMGSKPPNQSDRMFNDSGRMAESITANASKDGVWRVNMAANRLSGSPASVQRIYAKLVELVPGFKNIGEIMKSNDVLAAMVRTKEKMIRKGKMQSGKTALDVIAAGVRLFEQVAKIGA